MILCTAGGEQGEGIVEGVNVPANFADLVVLLWASAGALALRGHG